MHFPRNTHELQLLLVFCIARQFDVHKNRMSINAVIDRIGFKKDVKGTIRFFQSFGLIQWKRKTKLANGRIGRILSQNCLTCKCQALKVDPCASQYLRNAQSRLQVLAENLHNPIDITLGWDFCDNPWLPDKMRRFSDNVMRPFNIL